MADVIWIGWSGEEFRLLRKMLNRQLATMVDDCLVPHERCKEEYKLADAMAIKASRAEWMPQAAEPTQETRTGHGQGTDTIPAQQAEARPSTQAQSFKPALPPLESYQQRPANSSNQAGTGHVISEKQAKRLYAIQMKSGKKQYEVKEYLKRLGFNSSKEVTSDQYDSIVNWIQG